MKKFMTDIRTLAALLMAGTAFTACSSSDDSIIDEQPVNPAQKTYTLTVNASKGDGAQTRALTLEGKTLTASWATTENIYVKKGETWATGSLQPEADGTTATLKGSLSGVTIEANDNLTLQFPKSGDITYAGQLGTLDDIQANFDWATADVEVESVSASGNINPKAATTTFTNQQAIIKFTLLDKADGTTKLSPSALTVTDGTSTVSLTGIPADTYTTNGDGVLYVAFPAAGSAKTIKLTATVGTATYIYETATAKTFTNGQYYTITVKMTNPLTVPLTLEATSNGTIFVNHAREGMQYSLNGGEKTMNMYDDSWLEIEVTAGDKVAFYGNFTNITTYNGTCFGGNKGFQCKVYGNIMSLVNEYDFATATELSVVYALQGLFEGNTTLTDASGLLLPATTLSEYCYYRMFDGCTSLIAGPAELPATTLSICCYRYMFDGCTNLTTAPVLKAKALATSCYSNMFNGCTSLTTAPELKATTLANSCYYSMFNGCTSLTTAPELKATTLANSCYSHMFQNCTSLTTAPELKTTTLADECYSYMFQDCTSLTTAPELKATTLANYCYQGMFSGCTSLTTAPELPAPEIKTWYACYRIMFQNCTKLASVTCKATTFNNTSLTNWLSDAGTEGDSHILYVDPSMMTATWDNGNFTVTAIPSN